MEKTYKYSQWDIKIHNNNNYDIISIDCIGNWHAVYGIVYDNGTIAYDDTYLLPAGLKTKMQIWVNKFKEEYSYDV